MSPSPPASKPRAPSSDAPDYAIRPIRDREFAALRDLIQRESGIHLAPFKKTLLVARLARRLRELGLRSYAEYQERVLEDPDELVQMLDRITTNKTLFFREPAQFALLENEVFPEWASAASTRNRPRRVRAWSAGCSTGEEPYSLAMAMLEHFPKNEGWDLDITATDLSTEALEGAKAGSYPISKAENISQRRRERFMLKGTGAKADKMKVGPEIRALVRFGRLNLHAEHYSVRGLFDLILCRNVLIYFGREARLQVINRLVDLLSPDGLLLLGQTESLQGEINRVQCVIPAVYRHAAIGNSINEFAYQKRSGSRTR